MLRDVVKLGVISAVGLGVVATVGVGFGVAALIAGAIIAGVSSAEEGNRSTGSPKGGSTPRLEEKKLPKEGRSASPPVSSQGKRPSPESTKRQTSKPTTDIESKSDSSPESKRYAPNARDERKAPTSTSNVESKPDRALESKRSTPNGKEERKVPNSTPNRQRSSSVLVNKPNDATTSSSASKEGVPHVGSSNGTALPGAKPSSLSRELESQISPEIKEWKNPGPSSHEPRKRGAASGRGITEKRSSPAVQAKTETVPVPETTVNAPGPLPLLPPSPIPKPKSQPQLSEAIVEPQSKSEATKASVAEPIKEQKAVPAQNGISQDRLSKPDDRPPVPLVGSSKLDSSPPLQAVPAQGSQSEEPVSLSHTRESEAQLHIDVSPSSSASAPVEESTVLAADAKLAPTASVILPFMNGSVQGAASASRESLATVQRRNSKLSSAAKKVSHSVKKVFRSPDGKVIHSDIQRLASSSSDSVDSQRITELNGRSFSNLASSSRESLASTKSRRSLIDGTKKGFKRMFRGSSDNIEVPPVPPLPILTSTVADSDKPAVVAPESTPAPKPTKSIPAKKGHQHPSGQSIRNTPGAPDSGNNASPLLKGMFKGRVRR